MNTPNPLFHKLTLISLVSLIILILAWELMLTPIVSNSWWSVLVVSIKVIPLLIPLKGIWYKKIYTMQWLSMLILFYFIEGVVRSMSDINILSRALAGGETALSVILFFSTILYVRPFKKMAKAAKVAQPSISE
jgi:uncharacterized membrane protein